MNVNDLRGHRIWHGLVCGCRHGDLRMLAGVGLFFHPRISAVLDLVSGAATHHPAFAFQLGAHGMDFLIEIWTGGIVLVPSTEVWMDGQHECHCGKAAR